MLPSIEEEKKRYQQHHNSIEDKGYVSFLEKSIEPILPYLKEGMQGLDYGCGPAPVLVQLLHQKYCLHCDHYDLYFFPKKPEKKYDFIFSTETFEHFFQPGKELLNLYSLLRPKGLLCVMTNLYHSLAGFEQWWYRRDITHVCFYHTDTFHFIAHHFGFHILYHDRKQVVILQKT
ncbi:SAM-dependent methyltransferase [Catalinimonas alkaloidigena]|uniref:class I SAM-dependent methyltransferase n=1 Tax=Catalinimonas alkaloidigena TaxID=1075417 RepID=UPI002407582F|nr:class I SAM-dependent methyltransferase [Catalinimonas alkaloidigena]MDF9799849.1 SAM-dependent methyltransferase [Catalinimonas alkaloidigena]